MEINITNCDKEPIHLLGTIQPNGFLISVSIENARLNYISENAGAVLGIPVEDLAGISADVFFEKLQSIKTELLEEALRDSIRSLEEQKIPEVKVLKLSGKNYYLVAHSHDGNYIFEFEEKIISKDIFQNIYRINSTLLSAKNQEELMKLASEEIRKLIGYERVMIYRFLRDGSGKVVAESSSDGENLYLGHRFPESDIPKQARHLYTLNKVRVINDTFAEEIPLFGTSDKPLDLTYSILRSVSRMHIQYLANMGVGASFSISVMDGEALWGLIACHNPVAKAVDYQIRESCLLIADVISNSLRNFSEKRSASYLLDNNSKLDDMERQLEMSDAYADALLKGRITLLDFVQADGAAVYISGVTTTIGTVPAGEALKDIIRLSLKQEDVFETNHLKELLPNSGAKLNGICGVLSKKIGADGEDVLLWFRKEYPQQIDWAGKPDKIFKSVEISGITVHEINPRKSFETWRETIKDKSKPWSEEELATVNFISKKIYHESFRRSQMLEKTNKKLQVAYSELDNFIHSVSHDINNPLSVISLNSGMLLRKTEDDKQKLSLSTILQQTEKISHMLGQFRSLSRHTVEDDNKKEIEMPILVFDIIEELVARYGANSTIREVGELYNIYGNEIAVYQIFSNIIGNAIKYSAKSETPSIKIDSIISEDKVMYRIYDNGIGISNDGKDIFEAFSRGDSAQGFDGSGIGLSIVKNLLVRQRARVHYISGTDGGTCFYLNFPNPYKKM